ncbi:DUF305 domain-containing protein [Chitinophaga filiformis]|uniref:DUF305 domain-containing protein n=1 Tax=Chitinophaga filiformis TaxID=104663 RepID=A0ABY4I179_CHIFI|nr:DUF305 domain-containing protein [Chitinophaga filiformis]UPK68476.1 DUF305 domain-containing protein [Chitinophaga filiformis]
MDKGKNTKHDMHTSHYKQLIMMAVLSFICMYILMYAMVNSIGNVIPNINQFYMAGLMTMPMIIIEIVVMRGMYMDRKLNLGIMGLAALGLVAFFLCIRQQAAVSERQFLKSMIPHHAGAILMCEHANIKDPEIKTLCASIDASQQQEIEQMKTWLRTKYHR